MELKEETHKDDEEDIEDVGDLHEAMGDQVGGPDFISVVEIHELVHSIEEARQHKACVVIGA